MKTDVRITITEDGGLQFIYTDELAELARHGEATTARVSDVEPAGRGWTADMARVGGPVLGPFSTRAEALSAEVAWLHAYRNV